MNDPKISDVLSRVLFALICLFAFNGHAGITSSEVNSSATGYGLQPRSRAISVCFVGDALTSRPGRVQEISGILRSHFESAGDIHFDGFLNAGHTFPACSAPQNGTCGSDPCNRYPEDIRIAIDGTQDNGIPIPRQIPNTAIHCIDKGGPSSWGVSPWNVDKPEYRACQYNVFIGDDQDTSVTPPVFWTNHVLHEVGHALGLVHEFNQAGYHNYRGPNGIICDNSKSIPGAADNPDDFIALTPVDPASVMMYQDSSCGIDGNYSHAGLSALDRLSLQILYPSPERIAEYMGTTVVRVNEKVRLHASLYLRGANMDQAITGMQWSIGGLRSSSPIFEGLWSQPGTQKGVFTYKDFLGREFSTRIRIRVLSPNNFTSLIGASVSAVGLLL